MIFLPPLSSLVRRLNLDDSTQEIKRNKKITLEKIQHFMVARTMKLWGYLYCVLWCNREEVNLSKWSVPCYGLACSASIHFALLIFRFSTHWTFRIRNTQHVPVYLRILSNFCMSVSQILWPFSLPRAETFGGTRARFLIWLIRLFVHFKLLSTLITSNSKCCLAC